MNPNGKNFDWVTARAECSPAEQFHKLRDLAEENVDVQNRQLSSERQPVFKCCSGGRGTFTVFRNAPKGRAVVFTASEDGISIADDGNPDPLCHARLTLDRKGCCKFLVGEEQLDVWQLLHRALESLLFTST